MADPRMAIIDIGSNSVRFMLAEVTADNKVISQNKTLATTRLADQMIRTGVLSERRMADTLLAVRQFCITAEEQRVPVFAYATSAVRDARNRDEFLERIFDQTGLSVTVLTGEAEGRLAYLGATGGVGALIDIGGGSTQLVTNDFARSWRIGCVRSKDYCSAGSLDEMRKKLFLWYRGTFDLPELDTTAFTGVGGTITTIGALLQGQTIYDGSRLSACRITPKKLNALLCRLSDLGDSKSAHPLLRERHDVILQGGILLEYLMEQLRIRALIPCDRDGMEGFALSLLRSSC